MTTLEVLVFIMISMTLSNKEVCCVAVRPTGETLDMGGDGSSLERYERSVLDCSQQGESDEVITTITRATKVLCNMSVKRILCETLCDDDLSFSSTIRMTRNYSEMEEDLVYYTQIGQGKYLFCDIGLSDDDDSDTSFLEISCEESDDIPCEKESSSTDAIPSCHRCNINSRMAQVKCPHKEDKPVVPVMSDNNNNTSIGGVIGGVIGVVIGVVIIIVVVVMCWRRRRRRLKSMKSRNADNKMKDISCPDKEDVSDDDSLSDTPKGDGQSLSTNQYESITEPGGRQFGKTNKTVSSDDYTYIRDGDLKRNTQLTKGQTVSPLSTKQNLAFKSVGANENHDYYILEESEPVQKASDNSSVNEFEKDAYNHLGNTNHAFNHAGDTNHVPKGRDIYNRLNDANDLAKGDAYNRVGDLRHVPEVTDTYNRLGVRDVRKEANTYNRVGDVRHVPEVTDTYNRVGDVRNVPQLTDTYNRLGRVGDISTEAETYNRVGNGNHVRESGNYNRLCDTNNQVGNVKYAPKVIDTYNHLGNVNEDTKEPDTYNHLGHDNEDVGESAKEPDTYNRTGIDN